MFTSRHLSCNLIRLLRCLHGQNRRLCGSAAEVVHVSDPEDPRLTLYRSRSKRNYVEHETQLRRLAEVSLHGVQFVSDESNWRSDVWKLPLNRLPCVVSVHYSWDCVRRLIAAREKGHFLPVDSILIADGTAKPLMELARILSPVVFVAEPSLIKAELGSEGSDRDGSCSFVVTFPIQTRLSSLGPPFLILDGLGSAENVGQILRTAFHLGICSVIATSGAWNNLKGRACRVSMGWCYHMDFHLAYDLPSVLSELRHSGVQTYAAEDYFLEPVSPHMPQADRKWALVVGNEDSGISKKVLDLCDRHVCVPRRQGESLNVAHAAAIALYELAKNMDPKSS